MLGIKKIEDLIQKNGLEKNFNTYMSQQFDMKNPSKYIEDLDSQIFSFDFVQKVFMAAFVWKNILVDHVCKPIVVKRRKHLKDSEDKNYRESINHIKAFEEKAWESALDKVKKTV